MLFRVTNQPSTLALQGFQGRMTWRACSATLFFSNYFQLLLFVCIRIFSISCARRNSSILTSRFPSDRGKRKSRRCIVIVGLNDPPVYVSYERVTLDRKWRVVFRAVSSIYSALSFPRHASSRFVSSFPRQKFHPPYIRPIF